MIYRLCSNVATQISSLTIGEDIAIKMYSLNTQKEFFLPQPTAAVETMGSYSETQACTCDATRELANKRCRQDAKV